MSGTQVRLVEWQVVTPTAGSPTAGLDLGDDPAVRDLARRLAEARMLEVQELRTGLSVRSTSFVGQVRLGPVEITVVPKLRSETLLTLLRYAYGLRGLHLLPATAPRRRRPSDSRTSWSGSWSRRPRNSWPGS